MIAAVIGSRSLTLTDIGEYLPKGITEIVSGGAKGIDMCARQYALEHRIKLTEFIPEYEKYGRAAPLKRNMKIICYADVVIAFWDGTSKGTEYVIRNCRQMKKEIIVHRLVPKIEK